MTENPTSQSCFVPGISASFQRNFFYYVNWFSPLTMLLSVWCLVSNAIVIMGLFKSGIRSLRPGLLMVCSLAFNDLLWGATVAPLNAGIRIRNIMNRNVCEVHSQIFEMVTTTVEIPLAMCFLGTVGNLAVISIDRYLALRTWLRYKILVTRCRAVVVCSIVWVTSMTVGCLKQFKILRNTVSHFIMSGLVIPSALVIIIFQIMTLRLFRRHNNTVAQIMEAGGNQANTVSDHNAAVERELAKTTTYVVGLLGLFLIPMACVIITGIIVQIQIGMLLNPLIILLFTINSGMNPVLYYRGNKRVRQGISNLIKCQ